MITGNIVNSHCINLSGLSEAENASLRLLILKGELAHVSDIQFELKSKLNLEEQRFVLEKSLQIAGRTSELLQSTEQRFESGMENAADGADAQVQMHRLFLRGFAFARLGQTQKSEAIFSELNRSFASEVQIERGLARLNKGDLLGADRVFRQIFDVSGLRLEPYSVCTLLGGMTLTSIQLGRFAEAEDCLRSRQKILKAWPSPALEFGTKLYEILLFLEKNEFSKADSILSRSLRDHDPGSINGFFLSHLKLRLHLARNQLSDAQDSLQKLKLSLEARQVSEGAFDIRIEELELNLRAGQDSAAHVLIQDLMEHSDQRQDDLLMFRVQLLKAQTLYRMGRYQEAFEEVTKAIEIGTAKEYRLGLATALFHGAGISQAAGLPVQARILLSRGERLCRSLELHTRAACFAYMLEVASSGGFESRSLLSLVLKSEIGSEIEYYLNSYGFLRDQPIKVQTRSGIEVLEEADLRRKLFSEAGLFWFQREGILLAQRRDGQKRVLDLSGRETLLPVFRLIWSSYQSSGKGLVLRDIHSARSKVAYREDLHAGTAKTTLSRLREELRSMDLGIHYDREKKSYELRSSLDPFTIVSETKPLAGTEIRTDQELLSRIGMEPFVATRILCEEFGVTRQALHPWLKKLVDQGNIRLVKRGPVSGYMLVNAKIRNRRKLSSSRSS